MSRQNHDSLLLLMINKNKLAFLLIFVLISNCSFDDKTGIWSKSEKEKRRISQLEEDQKQIINVEKVYSTPDPYSKEISLKKSISLLKPNKNFSWEMSGLNHQNFLGNIYSSGVDSIFLKKKIGKNKFSISKNITNLLVFENSIIFSDDRGTIYSINQNGKINWKKNIYQKIYKRVYKNLTFSIYQNNIYVVDNIGFIYAVALDSGKLIWIKNHGIPLRSNIKIFKNKIFVINQDNRLLCLDSKNGSKIWDIRSISSFIKSQNFLSIAVSKEGSVIAINSSGDLFKANSENGSIYWSLNTAASMLVDATDFFKSSKIVVDNKNIFISAGSSFFSYNLQNGAVNWKKKLISEGAPIVVGKNIFLVTDNGYFVIIDKNSGEIISSNYILKILKKKKRLTKVTGYIMGSGKLFAVTSNGYLITNSAISGKAETFRKIGDPITVPPVISNGNLYILTENSKIIGFN